MAVHVVLMVLLLLCPHDVAAADLTRHLVPFLQRVPDSVIVGRTACGDLRDPGRLTSHVWLLNDAQELIEISLQTRTIAVHRLRGLRSDDAPWGLACVIDQSLWTLVTPRTLGRIARDGLIVERVSLIAPSIALFGAGPRLLLESLPLAPASAVFTAHAPRRPSEGRPWPGLMARSAPERADLLKRNIVNCGVAYGPAIPCWFPGDAQVSMSDGTRTDRRLFPSLHGAGIDTNAPLRDVAVSHDRFWLLTGSSQLVEGRRVGGPLVLATASGRELGRLSANPPFRVILSATDAQCFLLNARGELVEVDQP